MRLLLFLFNRLFKIISKNSIAKRISLISGLSILVPTAGMIIVLSVFNGLEKTIVDKYLDFNADVKIVSNNNKFFNKKAPWIKDLERLPCIEKITMSLEEQMLFSYKNKQAIVKVKGVDDRYKEVCSIDKLIINGNYFLKDKTVSYAVLGAAIAYKLNINSQELEPITCYIPNKETLDLNTPSFENKAYLYPSAYFSIDLEMDDKYVITNIGFVESMLNLEGGISAIELRINKEFSLLEALQKIEGIVPNEFDVKDRFMQEETLYKIMKSEKWMLFAILSMIVLLASVSIIGVISILLTSKSRDIYILLTLGINKIKIKILFVTYALRLSFKYSMFGLLLGLIILFLQIQFNLISINGTSFLISSYPVEIKLTDIFTIIVGNMIISTVTAIISINIINYESLYKGKN